MVLWNALVDVAVIAGFVTILVFMIVGPRSCAYPSCRNPCWVHYAYNLAVIAFLISVVAAAVGGILWWLNI